MAHSRPITQVLDAWRQGISDLKTRYFDERGAAMLAVCVAEVEAALEQEQDEPLTLKLASQESGYSVDHLGRMIRDGMISNAGRKGSPRILRRNLPVQNSRLRELSTPTQYAPADIRQTARSIVTSN